MASVPKTVNSWHKDKLYEILCGKIQYAFDDDASPRHVAVILPTGENNGWCEKGGSWC